MVLLLLLLLFNIISLHVNIILIVSFVSFTFFIFSLYMFVSFYRWLSLPFSPFSVCVSFSVSSSRSISFSPSTVSISFLTFLLLLGSLFIFDFFSFPLLLLLPSPISLFFSFPVWVFLLSPLVPLSRLFCFLSATLVFPFLLFSPFPQFLSYSFVSVSFPVPSSPLLADSSSCWSDLSPHLLCSSLMCFSFPFLSCLSSLPFSLSCLLLFCIFFTCPCSCLLHLFFFPLSISLTSSFLLPWLRPLSLLPYPVFLLFLSPSVSSSDVSSFGSVAFRPPPGLPPLPLHLVFDPLPLLVLLRFTLTLLSLFLPPVVFFGSSSCLSLLFGSLTYIYFLIFFLFPFSPLLLWFSFPL